jgi:hypothetical protein
MGHVAAPELPSQGGGARSYGTRGSVRTHLSKVVRSKVMGHVVATELPSQRGEVQGRGTRDGAGAPLLVR